MSKICRPRPRLFSIFYILTEPPPSCTCKPLFRTERSYDYCFHILRFQMLAWLGSALALSRVGMFYEDVGACQHVLREYGCVLRLWVRRHILRECGGYRHGPCIFRARGTYSGCWKVVVAVIRRLQLVRSPNIINGQSPHTLNRLGISACW